MVSSNNTNNTSNNKNDGVSLLKGDSLLAGIGTMREEVDASTHTSQIEALVRMLCGESVFLSGVAGAGKSFVVDKFVAFKKEFYASQGLEAQEIDMKIVATGSTGLAAANVGGRTIHSWSGLGFCDREIDTRRMWDKKYQNDMKMSSGFYSAVKRMREVETLIIDEVSMINALLLDNIDRVMRSVRKNNKPFGGAQLILVGDFMQLPPVKGEPPFEAEAWKKLDPTLLFLSRSMRSQDERLTHILNDMRTSTISSETREYITACKNNGASDNYVRLFTTNKDVDKYNKQRLVALPADTERSYFSGWRYGTVCAVSPYKSDANTRKMDEAKKQDFLRAGLPEDGVVTLRVGAVVIITRNIYGFDGRKKTCSVIAANGDSGVVTEMDDTFIKVKLNRTNSVVFVHAVTDVRTYGSPYQVDPKNVCSNMMDKIPQGFEAVVDSTTVTKDGSATTRTTARDWVAMTYLPVRLAFAITVHKSQGQTLSGVVVDLTKCFTPGLGYVALSRVSSLDSLAIEKIGRSAFTMDKRCAGMSTLVGEKALVHKQQFIDNLSTYELFVDNPVIAMETISGLMI